MSADNRSVATDALATLGTIIDDKQKRDAIHLAVFPAIAGANLARGADVRLDSEGLAVNADEGEGIGIVDPFLKGDKYDAVKPGQRFWLVIYPRKINSLRHVWSHPAFPDEQEVGDPKFVDGREESYKYLQAFAVRLFSYEPDSGTRFETLMAGAEYGGFGTDIEYGDDCTPNAEFWMHYERYTGRKVVEHHDYFRCAF